MANSITFDNDFSTLILKNIEESIDFENSFNSITFKNSFNSIIFKDDSITIIFDILQDNNVFPFTFPFNFS